MAIYTALLLDTSLKSRTLAYDRLFKEFAKMKSGKESFSRLSGFAERTPFLSRKASITDVIELLVFAFVYTSICFKLELLSTLHGKKPSLHDKTGAN